jgi:DNA-binding MarR family transcriptional regulator
MAKRETIFEAIEGLQALTEAYGERRRQLAAAGGLTEQQWRVLESIASRHFLPGLFARERRSSPAAVSRLLRQLQDAGLVRSSPGASDARQRVYALTARGERCMERIRAERLQAIRAIWCDLPDRALGEFTDLCGELSERLSHYASDA